MSNIQWVDLVTVEQRCVAMEADVCIIGAGAAGIYLTSQLVKRGRSVVLVEAGPNRGVEGTAIGFDVIFSNAPYSGATSGRFFGIGGSTTRWGGVLVPHTEYDLRAEDPYAETWAHIVSTVEQNSSFVLTELGYPNGSDFMGFARRALGHTAQNLIDSGFQIQAGLYLPFVRKNFVTILQRRSSRNSNTKLYFNAVTKDCYVKKTNNNKESCVEHITAVSSNGKELEVCARNYVICAGTIESARILLEIQDNNSDQVIRKTARTGYYLGDHLSFPIADVAREDLKDAAWLFAPRFSESWMRGFRLLDCSPIAGTPRYFTHFIFSNEYLGFKLAKETLGALQQRRMPKLHLTDIPRGLGDFVRLAYDRFVRSRLYVPVNTPAHLQLDMEQLPLRERRISLSNKRDSYGRRIPLIEWSISSADLNVMSTIAEYVLRRWPGPKVGLPRLLPRNICTSTRVEIEKPYDAYHPVGTCRMGNDDEAVVDLKLKVWGMSNLWVLSTGVLPTAGTANPTFTMLCLAHDLAKRL